MFKVLPGVYNGFAKVILSPALLAPMKLEMFIHYIDRKLHEISPKTAGANSGMFGNKTPIVSFRRKLQALIARYALANRFVINSTAE